MHTNNFFIALLSTITLTSYADDARIKSDITVTPLCSDSPCEAASFIPSSIAVATIELTHGNNGIPIDSTISNTNPSLHRWQIDPNNNCSLLIPGEVCEVGINFIGFKQPQDLLSPPSETLSINYGAQNPKELEVTFNLQDISWDFLTHNPRDNTTIPDNRVNAIAYDGNKTYFATRKGLAITTDNKTFTNKITDDYLLSIYADTDAVIVGSALNNSVYFSNNGGEEFQHQITLPNRMAINAVLKHDDIVYAAGTQQGLYSTAWPVSDNSEFILHTISDITSTNSIDIISHAEDTVIALGAQNGLFIKTGDADFKKVTFEVNGTENPAINDLKISSHGEHYYLFLGTDKGFAISKDSGETFTTVALIGNRVINGVSIQHAENGDPDQNTLYVATQNSNLFGSLDNGDNFIDVMGINNKNLTNAMIVGSTLAISTIDSGVGFPSLAKNNTSSQWSNR